MKAATTRVEVEDSFQEIALALMNSTLLEINGQDYKISEVEFYFQNEFFNDPFVHCQPRQKQVNQWYFHRKGDGFKDGKIKGLDITIGNENAFGGMLIRGIENVQTGEVIDGPSLVVDAILRAYQVEKVQEIAPTLEMHVITEANASFRLKEYDHKVLTIPTKCPRVGLTVISGENQYLRERFLLRDYRFLADPKKTEKFRHTIFLALINQGMSQKHAAEVVGLREVEALKYMFNYERGTGRNPLNYVDQKLNVLSQCEMMGSILGRRKAS